MFPNPFKSEPIEYGPNSLAFGESVYTFPLPVSKPVDKVVNTPEKSTTESAPLKCTPNVAISVELSEKRNQLRQLEEKRDKILTNSIRGGFENDLLRCIEDRIKRLKSELNPNAVGNFKNPTMMRRSQRLAGNKGGNEPPKVTNNPRKRKQEDPPPDSGPKTKARPRTSSPSDAQLNPDFVVLDECSSESSSTAMDTSDFIVLDSVDCDTEEAVDQRQPPRKATAVNKPTPVRQTRQTAAKGNANQQPTGAVAKQPPSTTAKQSTNTETTAKQPSSTETTTKQPSNAEAEAKQPPSTGATAKPPTRTETTAKQPSGTETTTKQPSNAEAVAKKPPSTGTTAKPPTRTETTAKQPSGTDITTKQPSSTGTTTKQPPSTAKQPTNTETASKQPSGTETTTKQPSNAGAVTKQPSSTGTTAKQPSITVKEVEKQPSKSSIVQPCFIDILKNQDEKIKKLIEQSIDLNKDILTEQGGKQAGKQPSSTASTSSSVTVPKQPANAAKQLDKQPSNTGTAAKQHEITSEQVNKQPVSTASISKQPESKETSAKQPESTGKQLNKQPISTASIAKQPTETVTKQPESKETTAKQPESKETTVNKQPVSATAIAKQPTGTATKQPEIKEATVKQPESKEITAKQPGSKETTLKQVEKQPRTITASSETSAKQPTAVQEGQEQPSKVNEKQPCLAEILKEQDEKIKNLIEKDVTILDVISERTRKQVAPKLKKQAAVVGTDSNKASVSTASGATEKQPVKPSLPLGMSAENDSLIRNLIEHQANKINKILQGSQADKQSTVIPTKQPSSTETAGTATKVDKQPSSVGTTTKVDKQPYNVGTATKQVEKQPLSVGTATKQVEKQPLSVGTATNQVEKQPSSDGTAAKQSADTGSVAKLVNKQPLSTATVSKQPADTTPAAKQVNKQPLNTGNSTKQPSNTATVSKQPADTTPATKQVNKQPSNAGNATKQPSNTATVSKQPADTTPATKQVNKQPLNTGNTTKQPSTATSVEKQPTNKDQDESIRSLIEQSLTKIHAKVQEAAAKPVATPSSSDNTEVSKPTSERIAEILGHEWLAIELKRQRAFVLAELKAHTNVKFNEDMSRYLKEEIACHADFATNARLQLDKGLNLQVKRMTVAINYRKLKSTLRDNFQAALQAYRFRDWSVNIETHGFIEFLQSRVTPPGLQVPANKQIFVPTSPPSMPSAYFDPTSYPPGWQQSFKQPNGQWDNRDPFNMRRPMSHLLTQHLAVQASSNYTEAQPLPDNPKITESMNWQDVSKHVDAYIESVQHLPRKTRNRFIKQYREKLLIYYRSEMAKSGFKGRVQSSAPAVTNSNLISLGPHPSAQSALKVVPITPNATKAATTTNKPATTTPSATTTSQSATKPSTTTPSANKPAKTTQSATKPATSTQGATKPTTGISGVRRFIGSLGPTPQKVNKPSTITSQSATKQTATTTPMDVSEEFIVLDESGESSDEEAAYSKQVSQEEISQQIKSLVNLISPKKNNEPVPIETKSSKDDENTPMEIDTVPKTPTKQKAVEVSSKKDEENTPMEIDTVQKAPTKQKAVGEVSSKKDDTSTLMEIDTVQKTPTKQKAVSSEVSSKKDDTMELATIQKTPTEIQQVDLTVSPEKSKKDEQKDWDTASIDSEHFLVIDECDMTDERIENEEGTEKSTEKEKVDTEKSSQDKETSVKSKEKSVAEIETPSNEKDKEKSLTENKEKCVTGIVVTEISAPQEKEKEKSTTETKARSAQDNKSGTKEKEKSISEDKEKEKPVTAVEEKSRTRVQEKDKSVTEVTTTEKSAQNAPETPENMEMSITENPTEEKSVFQVEKSSAENKKSSDAKEKSVTADVEKSGATEKEKSVPESTKEKSDQDMEKSVIETTEEKSTPLEIGKEKEKLDQQEKEKSDTKKEKSTPEETPKEILSSHDKEKTVTENKDKEKSDTENKSEEKEKSASKTIPLKLVKTVPRQPTKNPNLPISGKKIIQLHPIPLPGSTPTTNSSQVTTKSVPDVPQSTADKTAVEDVPIIDLTDEPEETVPDEQEMTITKLKTLIDSLESLKVIGSDNHENLAKLHSELKSKSESNEEYAKQADRLHYILQKIDAKKKKSLDDYVSNWTAQVDDGTGIVVETVADPESDEQKQKKNRASLKRRKRMAKLLAAMTNSPQVQQRLEQTEKIPVLAPFLQPSVPSPQVTCFTYSQPNIASLVTGFPFVRPPQPPRTVVGAHITNTPVGTQVTCIVGGQKVTGIVPVPAGKTNVPPPGTSTVASTTSAVAGTNDDPNEFDIYSDILTPNTQSNTQVTTNTESTVKSDPPVKKPQKIAFNLITPISKSTPVVETANIIKPAVFYDHEEPTDSEKQPEKSFSTTQSRTSFSNSNRFLPPKSTTPKLPPPTNYIDSYVKLNKSAPPSMKSSSTPRPKISTPITYSSSSKSTSSSSTKSISHHVSRSSSRSSDNRSSNNSRSSDNKSSSNSKSDSQPVKSILKPSPTTVTSANPIPTLLGRTVVPTSPNKTSSQSSSSKKQSEREEERAKRLTFEKEKERQIAYEKEKARKLELVKEKAKQINLDIERVNRMEAERDRIKKAEEAKEKARKLEAEKEKARKLAMEQEKARKIEEAKQKARKLAEEHERVRKLEAERERVRKLEEEREKARKLAAEGERLRQLELERERARKIEEDRERARMIQFERDRARKLELDRQAAQYAELERKRHSVSARDKERLVEWEKMELDRQVAKQMSELSASKSHSAATAWPKPQLSHYDDDKDKSAEVTVIRKNMLDASGAEVKMTVTMQRSQPKTQVEDPTEDITETDLQLLKLLKKALAPDTEKKEQSIEMKLLSTLKQAVAMSRQEPSKPMKRLRTPSPPRFRNEDLRYAEKRMRSESDYPESPPPPRYRDRRSPEKRSWSESSSSRGRNESQNDEWSRRFKRIDFPDDEDCMYNPEEPTDATASRSKGSWLQDLENSIVEPTPLQKTLARIRQLRPNFDDHDEREHSRRVDPTPMLPQSIVKSPVIESAITSIDQDLIKKVLDTTQRPGRVMLDSSSKLDSTYSSDPRKARLEASSSMEKGRLSDALLSSARFSEPIDASGSRFSEPIGASGSRFSERFAESFTSSSVDKPRYSDQFGSNSSRFSELDKSRFSAESIGKEKSRFSAEPLAMDKSRFSTEPMGPSRFSESFGPSGIDKSRFLESFGPSGMDKSRFSESFGPSGIDKSRFSESFGPSGMDKSRFSETLGPSNMDKSRFSETLGPSTMGSSRVSESLGPSRFSETQFSSMGPSRFSESFASMDKSRFADTNNPSSKFQMGSQNSTKSRFDALPSSNYHVFEPDMGFLNQPQEIQQNFQNPAQCGPSNFSQMNYPPGPSQFNNYPPNQGYPF